MHHYFVTFFSLPLVTCASYHFITLNFSLLILLWSLVLHCLQTQILLDLMHDLPDKSDSDDDFDGYLLPEDGPIVYCSAAELKDEATCS